MTQTKTPSVRTASHAASQGAIIKQISFFFSFNRFHSHCSCTLVSASRRLAASSLYKLHAFAKQAFSMNLPLIYFCVRNCMVLRIAWHFHNKNLSLK